MCSTPDSISMFLKDEVCKMRRDPKKKILLQEIVALAQEKRVLKSENDVIPALNHLHEHIVVYFAYCVELKNYVFVEAPRVFTILSHLN